MGTFVGHSPHLPKRLSEAFGAGELRLRRFGADASALDLDFDQSPPVVVSEVLACCAAPGYGTAPAPSLFAELTVSTRVVGLLQLVGLEGVETLVVDLACPDPNCGERCEVDLTLDEILAFADDDTDEPFTLELQTSPLTMRRPTGADQMAWLGARFEDVRAGRIAILRTLALSELPEDLDDSSVTHIEAALDAHDPLVCFSLTTACPACDAVAVHEVSLTDLALRVLRVAQARLFQSVHVLASHYGWSEAAVLELPPWRRARYLSLVERAGG